MEQSWNSEGDILTKSEAQFTIKPRLFPVRDNPGVRLEMIRYSWEELKKDTGCGTGDVMGRMVDYGVAPYCTSHHPWLFPEPFTPELG